MSMLQDWISAAAATFALPVSALIAGAVVLAAAVVALGWWSMRTAAIHGAPDDDFIERAQSGRLDIGWLGRPFVQSRAGFAMMSLVLIGAFGLAAALASNDLPMLLTSIEWQSQPLYLAAHLITLRYFLRVFAINFLAGVRHLDIPMDRARDRLKLALGTWSGAIALILAVPFWMTDLDYLRRTTEGRVSPADYVLWGIWMVEWAINALLWVTVLRFYLLNRWTLTTFRFCSGIHTAILRKQYRPFLRMSSQGSGIVMLFAVANIAYIAATGGDIGDYVGLAVTATLVVIGFCATWALVNSRVRGAVQRETVEIQSTLADLHTPAPIGPENRDRRLDEIHAMLRLAFLEGLNHRLGVTEARAVLFRLAAPALTVAWQVSNWSANSHLDITKLMLDARRAIGL